YIKSVSREAPCFTTSPIRTSIGGFELKSIAASVMGSWFVDVRLLPRKRILRACALLLSKKRAEKAIDRAAGGGAGPVGTEPGVVVGPLGIIPGGCGTPGGI